MKWTKCKKWNRNSEKLNFQLNLFLWFRINYSRNWQCFDQGCVNRTETVLFGTLRFLNLSHLLYGICENIFIIYEIGIFIKELHNEQEYYCPTTYRAGAAVVPSITSYISSSVGFFLTQCEKSTVMFATRPCISFAVLQNYMKRTKFVCDLSA